MKPFVITSLVCTCLLLFSGCNGCNGNGAGSSGLREDYNDYVETANGNTKALTVSVNANTGRISTLQGAVAENRSRIEALESGTSSSGGPIVAGPAVPSGTLDPDASMSPPAPRSALVPPVPPIPPIDPPSPGPAPGTSSVAFTEAERNLWEKLATVPDRLTAVESTVSGFNTRLDDLDNKFVTPAVLDQRLEKNNTELLKQVGEMQKDQTQEIREMVDEIKGGAASDVSTSSTPSSSPPRAPKPTDTSCDWCPDWKKNEQRQQTPHFYWEDCPNQPHRSGESTLAPWEKRVEFALTRNYQGQRTHPTDVGIAAPYVTSSKPTQVY